MKILYIRESYHISYFKTKMSISKKVNQQKRHMLFFVCSQMKGDFLKNGAVAIHLFNVFLIITIYNGKQTFESFGFDSTLEQWIHSNVLHALWKSQNTVVM